MARLSLYDKLKARPDYDKILKRLNVVKNPTNYIMDTFSCSSITARKLLKDLDFKGETSSYEVIAEAFVTELDQLFNDNPSARTFIKVGEKVESLPYKSLVHLLCLLSGMRAEPDKWLLIRTIKYLIQCKFYSNVFKISVPTKIFDKSLSLLKDCEHAQVVYR